MTRKEKILFWTHENARSMAYFVYFSICIFDFIIMPMYIEMTNKDINIQLALDYALKFKDSASQTNLIRDLLTKRTWEPLTMGGAAAFHLAFGALLTGAAWTRGQEKIARVKANKTKVDNPDE